MAADGANDSDRGGFAGIGRGFGRGRGGKVDTVGAAEAAGGGMAPEDADGLDGGGIGRGFGRGRGGEVVTADAAGAGGGTAFDFAAATGAGGDAEEARDVDDEEADNRGAFEGSGDASPVNCWGAVGGDEDVLDAKLNVLANCTYTT